MQIVGILNCSPDSYFEGGRFADPNLAIEHALRLFDEGADIVDIGGESTRPGSDVAVSVSEELRRVLPVIKGIRAKTDRPLSIDTFKPEVAEAALIEGVQWINDITGLSNPRMRELVRSSKATACIMHMYGDPHTLPNPYYPQGIVQAILHFFQVRLNLLITEGILPSQLILDPGIGGGAFGKNPDECLQIIQNIAAFVSLGYPILIGLSRKSFLQKIFHKPPSEVLSTTLALNTIAHQKGAAYIRVHDVAAHKDVLTILKRLDTVN
jgi:dihydropteroate synthase